MIRTTINHKFISSSNQKLEARLESLTNADRLVGVIIRTLLSAITYDHLESDVYTPNLNKLILVENCHLNYLPRVLIRSESHIQRSVRAETLD